MESKCDYCSDGRATVYCKADSAKLCLSCDRQVHSANSLSLRHVRTLLCDRCKMRPATLRCPVEGVSLCPNCDWEVHGGPNGPQSSNNHHKRHTFESFTGCPSPADLASLWGFESQWGFDVPARLSLPPKREKQKQNVVSIPNAGNRSTWGAVVGCAGDYGPMYSSRVYGRSPDSQPLGGYMVEQQQRMSVPGGNGDRYGGSPMFYPQMGSMGPPSHPTNMQPPGSFAQVPNVQTHGHQFHQPKGQAHANLQHHQDEGYEPMSPSSMSMQGSQHEEQNPSQMPVFQQLVKLQEQQQQQQHPQQQWSTPVQKELSGNLPQESTGPGPPSAVTVSEYFPERPSNEAQPSRRQPPVTKPSKMGPAEVSRLPGQGNHCAEVPAGPGKLLAGKEGYGSDLFWGNDEGVPADDMWVSREENTDFNTEFSAFDMDEFFADCSVDRKDELEPAQSPDSGMNSPSADQQLPMDSIPESEAIVSMTDMANAQSQHEYQSILPGAVSSLTQRGNFSQLPNSSSSNSVVMSGDSCSGFSDDMAGELSPRNCPQGHSKHRQVSAKFSSFEEGSNPGSVPGVRDSAVQRYLEKKKRRKYGKVIQYQLRKDRADVRKRIKGRFVKPGEAFDYDPLSKVKMEDE